MRSFPSWIKQVEGLIGVSFRDKSLLYQSFVHRSYLNEDKEFSLGSNERMGFIGDKALSLVVANYLYLNYSHDRGVLAAVTSALSKGSAYARIANDLGLADFLLMGKGQKMLFKTRENKAMLEDTLKAIVGAIFLDRGLGVTEIFISEYLLEELPAVIDEMSYVGPKIQLQELAQEKLHIMPRYKILIEEGLDNNKTWTVGVFIDDRRIGVGKGPNKKKAENEAAKFALEHEFLVPTKD